MLMSFDVVVFIEIWEICLVAYLSDIVLVYWYRQLNICVSLSFPISLSALKWWSYGILNLWEFNRFQNMVVQNMTPPPPFTTYILLPYAPFLAPPPPFLLPFLFKAKCRDGHVRHPPTHPKPPSPPPPIWWSGSHASMMARVLACQFMDLEMVQQQVRSCPSTIKRAVYVFQHSLVNSDHKWLWGRHRKPYLILFWPRIWEELTIHIPRIVTAVQLHLWWRNKTISDIPLH